MKKIATTTCLLSLLCSASAFAAAPVKSDLHNWQVRLRAIDVAPAESSTVSNSGKIVAGSRLAPELDISYFFSENVSAELILATTKHKMDERGPNINLGDVWVLPPTLTAQYHFTNASPFVPYIGAGVNYTIFYNVSPGGVSSIKYENGFGYALQAGFDYKLDQHWMLNADIKKIFLNTDAKVNGGAVTADVDLDPWVIGFGVGYRF